MYFQCNNCGNLKLYEEVKRKKHTDGRTSFFKCINECETKVGVEEWLVKFPGSFKKLDKFLEENPQP
jgi:hypothetical protein